MGWYRNDQSDVWDPARTGIMIRALDEACQRARAKGIMIGRNGKPAREALARYIVAMARRGELREERLVQGALRHLRSH